MPTGISINDKMKEFLLLEAFTCPKALLAAQQVNVLLIRVSKSIAYRQESLEIVVGETWSMVVGRIVC
jgi:hypothetical protein